ncbi:MAG TPA: ABC transporter substrate-binding protein [Microbacterium sp.]|nr:ABC transporter substrate-binding protein [Microbacterium sp.]
MVGSVAVILSLGLSTIACAAGGGDDTDSTGGGDGEAQSGGSVTTLLDAGFSGGWNTGLDPATSNTVGANLPQNSAIFGGLFTLEADEDGGNAGIVDNQAESHEWSDDDLTLTIKLREGVTFSDGTPMNAEAVVWNWIRALNSGSTGTPRLQLNLGLPAPELSQEFLDSLYAALPADVDRNLVQQQLGTIVAVDDLTVSITLAAPDGSFVNGFPTSSLNLIASPTAFAEQGADDFKENPVGAGPFIITSNTLSERLELEKNSEYFKDGLPYLDTLNFQSILGDQVLYQTLQAGQGDVIEGMANINLIQEAEGNPDVGVFPGVPTSPYVIQLNTRKPPFDDIKAREAIYYATDFEAINKGLFKDTAEMSQSFTASGGLFYNPEVEGYRTYDPAKAKELVDEIGGLTVNLGTVDVVTAKAVTTALQTQWAEAGIDVEIEAAPLGDVITSFISGEWESLLQTAGAWDPSVGIGVAVRFGSQSPFSGAPQPTEPGGTTELDDLLADAVATTDEAERKAVYDEIAKYISDEAYAPFGMAFSPSQIVRTTVHGPGLTTPIPALAVNSGVLYDRVWIEQ